MSAGDEGSAGVPDRTGPALGLSGLLPTLEQPHVGGAGGAADETPEVLVDHFELLRLLGRGGMGDVYLARDTRLGRKVALKVIRAEHLGSEAAAARFLREARTTARFSHPNIVTVHAVGDVAGLLYLALEYLEGQSLRERLAERQPSLRETMRVGVAVARALAEAHDRGVLHRDLKPDNIIIPRDGRVRVVDFGLAKRVPGAEPVTDDGEGPISSRLEGDVVGTPAYLAPELWRGEPASPASDVWSLGITLFELCAGDRPFAEEGLETLALEIAREGPAPSLGDRAEVPKPLSAIVDRCLAKAPADRPRADEVAEALEAQLHGRHGATTDGSPFRGLLPFTEAETDLFFGREDEITAFCERIRHESVLPVVGPSGAGKSSFVRAGVIPRLAEQRLWTVLQLRPGSRPLLNLAARVVSWRSSGAGSAADVAEDDQAAMALAERLAEAPAQLGLELRTIARHTGSSLLLFVDQLEELFTLEAEPAERRGFIEAICAAADDPQEPVRAVLAVRDDYLGRVVTSPAAREALSHVTVLQRPDDQALAQILRAPVDRVGYDYDDPGLVTELVDAVGGQPSCLPLLQFSAQRLWEGRDRTRKLLLRKRYEQMGGVAGALARHADAVIEGLTPADRTLARALLLRLVTPERTRRVVSEAALLGGLHGDAAQVLARLTRARLVAASRATAGRQGAQIELIHESLIANWQTLNRWIDAAREELTFLADIGPAAERWHERGRREDELLRGVALLEAQRGARKCSAELPIQVKELLHASDAHRRRRIRQRRALLATAFATLVVALGAAIYAALLIADREREARRQEQVAQQEHNVALREAARAALGQERMLEARAKLRLALEAGDAPAARALWWQLDRDPLRWRHQLGAFAYSAAFSPLGPLVAAASQDGSVYLFDIHTGAPRVLRGHADQVLDVAFSLDGQQLASGDLAGQLRVWDVATGSSRPPIEVRARVAAVAFTPGGQQVVSGDAEGYVRFWNSATGEPGLIFGGDHGALRDLAIRPDGRLIATCVSPPAPGVRLCDASTGEVVRRLEPQDVGCERIAFSADGKLLATTTTTGVAQLFEVSSGDRRAAVASHHGGTTSVSVAPDGQTVALGRFDGGLRDLVVANGKRRTWRQGTSEAITGLDYGPSGNLLVTASRAGEISLWTVAGGPKNRGLGPHGAAVYGVRFSPDGQQLATSSADKTVRIWDVASGAPVRAFTGHTAVVSDVRFSHDGQRLVTASYDGTVRIWDLDQGVAAHELRGHTGRVRAAAFSPDDSQVASVGGSRLRLWDAATGRQTGSLTCSGYPMAVTFSGDGREVAAGTNDGHVCVWLAASGTPLRKVNHGAGPIRSLRYSPDDERLAAAHEQEGVLLIGRRDNDLSVLRRDWGRAYTAAFHPDGERLAVASSDQLGRLIGLSDASVVKLLGHRAEVNRVDFHPDGSVLATSSDDGTVRLWHTASGEPYWRAPLLLAQPARLLTHQGWIRLDDGMQAPAQWPGGPRSRAVAENQARQAVHTGLGDGARLCAWLHDGAIEVWDLQQDERLSRHGTTSFGGLVVNEGRCVALADGRVRLLDGTPSGRALDLGGGATALSASAGRLLVAVDGAALALDETGAEQARFTTGAGVRTMALSRDAREPLGPPDALVVGYGDGNLELRSLGDPASPLVFERTPSARPARIVTGPVGTVAVGYANGVVGLWSRRDGSRVAAAQLHGAVVHLLLDGDRLYAATDLGDHLVWDLGVFHRDYCDLLREVWREVPIVWQVGRAQVQPPPPGHRCAPR